METFTKSLSGASRTCNHCGTIYNLHGVDQEDCIPPVGDGCEHCNIDVISDGIVENWVEDDDRDPREDWFDDGSGQVIPEGKY